VSGALEIQPQDVAGEKCGAPGSPPGNRSQGGPAAGGQRSAFGIPTLPDVVGQVPVPEASTGRLGLPPVPGVQAP
jgi:phospholipid/cholesterol/gamma-HCH transport system substrate-binding protein